MVHMNADQLQEAMCRQRNIRNIAVIAHVDHGKTTLTDSLLSRAGVIASHQAGDKRATDTRKDEKERGITIKSTGISLYYELSKEDTQRVEHNESLHQGFLINLVDSPGHVDFSPEVTAALRVVDGAMVVVDCISGVSVQTETVLRQAIAERIRPVVMVNKLDRAIFEKQLTSEEIYRSLSSVVDSINGLISTYAEDEGPMGHIVIDPSVGNVAFGAGLHGWGFNLRQFARLYSNKFGVKEEKMMSRLWGPNFFNPKTKQWSKVQTEGSVRGFNQFVMDPLLMILKASSEGDKEKVNNSLKKLGISLSAAELALEGKDFMKVTMRTWLPAADAMLDMIVTHLPSPVTAQTYRTEILYEGPLDDEAAVAMKACNPSGPLMMFVSKMVPSNEKGHFYAVGRVFSGTIKSGQKVRIMGPDYDPASPKKKDFHTQSLSSPKLMMGGQVLTVEEAQCGNIVGLTRVDKYLIKTGTISTYDMAHNLKVLKFSVSPVVRVAVDVAHPQDLVKLIDGLRRLSQADCLVQCTIEGDQHIVAGSGELHLDICLKDLEEEHAGVPIKKSEPVVKYCETVTGESDRVCLAKSVNKHNRLYMTASSLSEELCEEIVQGGLSHDPKVRARYLADTYDFDVSEARKIWCFGPQESGPNMLLDVAKGVNFSDVKDAVCAGFQWATEEGVLCAENMRGIRFNIVDGIVHSDPAHRGGGQIIPIARRAMMSSMLTASPAMMEPVYLVETQCPSEVMGSVMSVISRRRGEILEQTYSQGSPLLILKSHMPVMESFGFSAELMNETSGKAFPQCIFDHWQRVPGDVRTEGSKAASVVAAVRQRKGLAPGIPAIETLLDKL